MEVKAAGKKKTQTEYNQARLLPSKPLQVLAAHKGCKLEPNLISSSVCSPGGMSSVLEKAGGLHFNRYSHLPELGFEGSGIRNAALNAISNYPREG